MNGHLLHLTHVLSLIALDILKVTYYNGHVLLLIPLDTLTVTYCTGHMSRHLLRWTHCQSLGWTNVLSLTDTLTVTYFT
jgi:hypothetical protein